VPPSRADRAAALSTPAPGGAAGSRRAGFREHGPYAAKQCDACHDPGATNALVLPADQLCFQCHDLKLDKKYIHGPLASGGCLVCHDPHSSQYRYLLVSESDGFCLHCHDRKDLSKVGAHADLQESCTTCHDAHMSDSRYLLK
jgi:predicted CXXCH cytochrome family protein